jgi:hypothetical protein
LIYLGSPGTLAGLFDGRAEGQHAEGSVTATSTLLLDFDDKEQLARLAANVKRSWPLGKRSCRRLDAGLEHVERIEAARFAVGWKKDRVSAAMDRSDNHKIVSWRSARFSSRWRRSPPL